MPLLALSSFRYCQAQHIKPSNTIFTEDRDDSLAALPQNGFYDIPYNHRNSGAFSKDVSILSFGYGFNVNGNFDNGDYEPYMKELRSRDWNRLGAFYGKFEHGIIDELGIGINLSYAKYKFTGKHTHANEPAQVLDEIDEINANIHFYSATVMVYYHFNKLIPVKDLDVYMGLGLGAKGYTFHLNPDYENYWNQLEGDPENGYNMSKVTAAARFGVRYYITNWFGIYGNVGYDGFSNANLGISFAFGRKSAVKHAFIKQKHVPQHYDNQSEEDTDIDTE